jgi:hypothetical protein
VAADRCRRRSSASAHHPSPARRRSARLTATSWRTSRNERNRATGVEPRVIMCSAASWLAVRRVPHLHWMIGVSETAKPFVPPVAHTTLEVDTRHAVIGHTRDCRALLGREPWQERDVASPVRVAD